MKQLMRNKRIVRCCTALFLICLVFSGLGAQELTLPAVASQKASFKVVRLVSGLENPWCIAFVPDGRILLTQRSGKLAVFENGTLYPVGGVPAVSAIDQGGFFETRPVPNFATSARVVLSYAHAESGQNGLRVTTATLRGNKTQGYSLVDLKPIWSMKQYTTSTKHYGGRLAFLPDNTLLISTGDRGSGDRAQNPADAAGKIHRVNLDGTVPSDNPFVKDTRFLPSIWTWGHRNIQGMLVSADGSVWANEHGPQGGDEVNRIVAGKNYGWPVITYGVQYGSGTKIGEGSAKAGLEQPVLYWAPSIAPSGFAQYAGAAFPEWKNSFFVGGLAGRVVVRLEISTSGQSGGNPVFPKAKRGVAVSGQNPAEFRLNHEEILIDRSLGRVRDIAVDPAGMVYIVDDSAKGSLYRVEP